jgi:hypothetical protein
MFTSGGCEGSSRNGFLEMAAQMFGVTVEQVPMIMASCPYAEKGLEKMMEDMRIAHSVFADH